MEKILPYLLFIAAMVAIYGSIRVLAKRHENFMRSADEHFKAMEGLHEWEAAHPTSPVSQFPYAQGLVRIMIVTYEKLLRHPHFKGDKKRLGELRKHLEP